MLRAMREREEREEEEGGREIEIEVNERVCVFKHTTTEYYRKQYKDYGYQLSTLIKRLQLYNIIIHKCDR